MIDDLDETIRQLLKTELPVTNGDIDIKFDQPTRQWSQQLNKPTLNLFLYDVRENNTLRQHQWQRMQGNGNGRNNTIGQKRTPFRVDCFYMVTSWVLRQPEDEHRLLAACMLALFRHPILEGAILAERLRNQPFEIQTRLASHDRLTNPAEVWSALDNEMRPSVSFIVTLAMDPWAVISDPVVRTRRLDLGQSTALPDVKGMDSDTAVTSILIGGRVIRNNEPQANVKVTVKETGQIDMTNKAGQFKFGSLTARKYTLVAEPEKGKAKERAVTISIDKKVDINNIDFDDDYDIEL